MKENNPNLSIVIATYNAGKTLEIALESIVSLDYDKWECIVVDGNSKDNTLNIVAKYEKEDARIRHVSEPDNGLYDAFNKGWKFARAPWIYYLGSDDKLTNSGIGGLMKYVDAVDDNVAIISGGVTRVRQDGSTRVMMSKGFVGSHQSMITRRTVLEALNGFDDKKYGILADFDLFTRIKNNGYGVKNCDAVVAYFNAGGTSEQFGNICKIFQEKYRILKYDRYCHAPLLWTARDTAKTLLGSVYHRMMSKMRKK